MHRLWHQGVRPHTVGGPTAQGAGTAMERGRRPGYDRSDGCPDQRRLGSTSSPPETLTAGRMTPLIRGCTLEFRRCPATLDTETRPATLTGLRGKRAPDPRLRGRSSIGLEHRLVTPKVAGSSPVGLVTRPRPPKTPVRWGLCIFRLRDLVSRPDSRTREHVTTPPHSRRSIPGYPGKKG